MTDRGEYSRSEPKRSVIRARVLPTPATGLNETVTVSMRRRDGNVIAAQAVVLSGDYPKGVIVTFDTAAIADPAGFALCTRGNFSLVAQNATASVASPPAPFAMALITADEMKNGYCHGLPLTSRAVMMPKKQPQLVTGVTITRVSPDTPPGLNILTFTPGTPPTLRWNQGALVDVEPGMTDDVLPDELGNYAEVSIDSFELPDGAASEGVLVDYDTVSDDTIQAEILKAASELERVVGTRLEPTRMATDPYFSAPEPGEWFDEKAKPGVFYRASVFPELALVWHISLPYIFLQTVTKMCGYFGDKQSIEISSGTFKCNERQGIVEVLPRDSSYTYFVTFFAQLDFWGIREYIADFWRYKAVVGMRDLEPDLLKFIGYTAALPLLVIAGQSARGGYNSESTSKDGVSTSSSVSNGLYDATIKEMKEWLKENKPRIQSHYRSFVTTVL